MNKIIPLAAFFAAACVAPQAAYAPEDPLSGAAAPTTVYAAAPGGAKGAPLFTAVLPKGWEAGEGVFSAGAGALLRTDTPWGEAVILAERFTGPGAIRREDFTAHLVDGPAPAPTTHSAGGAALTAYHGMRFALSERRIGPEDPWRESLGQRVEPPKLSVAEGRRFLTGGEAYRLYRCSKLGAWGVLGDYRRAQAKGKTADFLASHPPEERRLVSNCFGPWVSRAVAESRPVPAIEEPGLGALRAMAREEWEKGAVMRRERECVVLLDAPGGFWSLRLRAPEPAFEAEHAAFMAVLGSFRPN